MSTTSAVPLRRVGAAHERPPQARRTQSERRAESERRLLHAAAELFVERGIDGTSLAEIGRRAGYSHSLVNHRFGSKDALIERLNEEGVRMFTASMIDRIGSSQGADAVGLVARTYLELVHGPDMVARVHLLVWGEAMTHGSNQRPYWANWDRIFQDILASMIKAGIAEESVRSDLDPLRSAAVIVGLLRGVALQVALDPKIESTERARESALEHLDRMLRPENARRVRPGGLRASLREVVGKWHAGGLRA